MRASLFSLVIIIFQSSIFVCKTETTVSHDNYYPMEQDRDYYAELSPREQLTTTEFPLYGDIVDSNVTEYGDYDAATYDPATVTEPHHTIYGNAIFASSFIRECRYGSARRLLKVEKLLGINGYSGFITVDRRYNSNLFFWLILSQQEPNKDPLVTWLMGCPGYSSMYGVFQENGPFQLSNADRNLTYNNNTWTKRYNMLYIDNPVGIGYSFTENEAGYSKNQDQVAANLYEFMSQFYEIFPNFRDNELYVAGESHGAKFSISLAYTIHKRNPLSHLKMNLQGIFVGNGFLDPINMITYSSFLYRLGIIDYGTYLWMKNLEKHLEKLIRMKDWTEALALLEKINEELRKVGFDHPYDITEEKFEALSDFVPEYLNDPETRKQLHVGEVQFHNEEIVYEYLRNDYLQSVKKKVEELLFHYRMLFYTGQYDALVTHSKLNAFSRHLKWADAVSFAKQDPINWYVDDEVAGYVTKVSNLTVVLVRGANHMGAMLEPRNIYGLLRLFTDKRPVNDDTLRMRAFDK